MSVWYVNSNATGSGAGTSWANAATSFASLLALGAPPAAGDTIYVAGAHAESYAAATTLTFPGTNAAPNQIICVDTANQPPQEGDLVPTVGSLTAGGGATVSSSATFGVAGSVYCRGVTFALTGSTGVNLNVCAAIGAAQRFELCLFSLAANSAGSSRLFAAENGAYLQLLNCGYRFGSVSQAIAYTSVTISATMRGGYLDNTGSIPTTLFAAQSNRNGALIIDGVDLSAAAAGKSLVNPTAALDSNARALFVNCKLGPGVSIVSAAPASYGEVVDLINCDSGADSWRNERYDYAGTLTTDTTDVRSGGQTDGNGTPFAWKIVTTANAQILFPFEMFELDLNIPAAQVGAARTATLYFMSNAALTNADVWAEVVYMGNTTDPQGLIASNGLADPLAASNGGWPIDAASTWNTTGVSGPIQQLMTVSFTPQLAGACRVRVKVARPSQTLRIDPAIYLT